MLATLNFPLAIAGLALCVLALLMAAFGRRGASRDALPGRGVATGPWLLSAACGLAGGALVYLAVGPARPAMPAAAVALDPVRCEAILSAQLQQAGGGAAAAASVAPAEPPRHAVGLVSGTVGGTYHAIGADLVEIARRQGLTMFNRSTNGGLDNLDRLGDRHVNAALGFVQGDLLAWLQASNDPAHRRLAGELRLIAPLFAEEIHVLARRELGSLQALQSRRVLTASSSQGSRHTAENLLRARGIRPAVLDSTLTFAQAVCALVSGQADALVAVAGRPMAAMRALQALAGLEGEPLAQLHLLPVPAVAEDPGYEVTRLGPDDYPWMSAPVQTLAVRAVLMAMDFAPVRAGADASAYRRMRCQQLAAMAQAVRGGLPQLQQPPFHPKWRDVDWNRTLPGWRIDRCSGGLGAAGSGAGAARGR